MVVAMQTSTTPVAFTGEVARDTVLAHVERGIASGLEKDEAITRTIDAIIHSGHAVKFVRMFGSTMIKEIIRCARIDLHPANYPGPDGTTDQPTDRDDGNGQAAADIHQGVAAPPPFASIPQGFPAPGTGRVHQLDRLRDPRPLVGVLSGPWAVDGADVPLGLLTAAQCFKLAASETRRGRAHVTNGTMFRSLGESLQPGEVVADRWDDAKVNKLYEQSQPKII